MRPGPQLNDETLSAVGRKISECCGLWKVNWFVSLGEQTNPMPPTFNAYIDGFNLYKGVLATRPHLKWLNLRSWCESLLPEFSLNSVYYFTSRVKRRFDNDKAPERQHLYLRALEKSGVEIAYGRTRKSSKWHRLSSSRRTEVLDPELRSYLGLTQLSLNSSFRKSFPDSPKARVSFYEEKGTDVNLSSYLLRDTFREGSKASLIISGDADLLTPIRFASEEGQFIKIIVPNSGQKISALRAVSSEIEVVDPDVLLNFQFPSVYKSPSGRRIQRPESWT